jgi:hypothetical protein
MQKGGIEVSITPGPVPVPVSDEVHAYQCEVAGCRHPAVHLLEDGETWQGWCARCRAVAFGGVYEGVAFVDGVIVDATTGEPLPL